MTNKLRQLFETHGFMSMRKQRAFAQFLGNHAWEYVKADGTISLPAQGKEAAPRVYPVQVLGTESEQARTWLWAWSNPESAFPPEQLQAAERLRQYGEEHGIEELTVPRLPLDRVQGHLLASLALGVLDYPAYYRGGVSGTHLVCLLSDTPEPPPLTAVELLAVLNDGATSFEFRNHREATDALFAQLGWPVQREAQASIVTSADNLLVTIDFDDRDRLKKLSTRLVGKE